MHNIRFMHLLPVASLVLASCGAQPAAPSPITPPPPVNTAAPQASAAPQPAGPIEPTVLSEEQKKRDAALAPRAAEIVDAFPNLSSPLFVAQLTRDKKRVVFSSPRDGLPQIYLGDVMNPSVPPKALTSGGERAIWAAFTEDQKSIVFARDEGGDEAFNIWRVGLDGLGLTNLTPGEKARRDVPFVPRKKPGMMVYTSRTRSSPSTKLMVQSMTGGDPKLVYEDPAPAWVVDVSADGSRALLRRWVSSSEIVLMDVDTAGGKPATRLYPPEGTKATVQGTAWSWDGKLIYLATDEGKDSIALLAMDPKTKQIQARWAMADMPSASIGDVQVSPKGDRIVLLISAGNTSEIRILDARRLTLQTRVKTPPGALLLGTFTADGSSIPFGMSTADKPSDIYLLDAKSGTYEPLRDDPRPALANLPSLTTSIEKVTAHDGLTIPVNLHLPAVEQGQKLPTIVLFHGGPAESSFVRWNPFVRFFAAQGYAVAEPNIRGSTGFGRAYEMADDREKRADALRDVATVNAWAKAQPWCDPGRVIAAGGSYGGYVTLMALTRQPKLWSAGIDLFGIANLRTFLRTTVPAIRAGFVQEFGDLDKDAALIAQFDPSRDFDKIESPLFVYAGQNDWRVPRSESDQVVRALLTRGVPVEYMVMANEGHAVTRREAKIEFMVRVVRFLDEHTK